MKLTPLTQTDKKTVFLPLKKSGSSSDVPNKNDSAIEILKRSCDKNSVGGLLEHEINVPSELELAIVKKKLAKRSQKAEALLEIEELKSQKLATKIAKQQEAVKIRATKWVDKECKKTVKTAKERLALLAWKESLITKSEEAKWENARRVKAAKKLAYVTKIDEAGEYQKLARLLIAEAKRLKPKKREKKKEKEEKKLREEKAFPNQEQKKQDFKKHNADEWTLWERIKPKIQENVSQDIRECLVYFFSDPARTQIRENHISTRFRWGTESKEQQFLRSKERERTTSVVWLRINSYISLTISEYAKVNNAVANQANKRLYFDSVRKSSLLCPERRAERQKLLDLCNDKKLHIPGPLDRAVVDLFYANCGKQLRGRSLNVTVSGKELTKMITSKEAARLFSYLKSIVSSEFLLNERPRKDEEEEGVERVAPSKVGYAVKIGFSTRKLMQFLFRKHLIQKYEIKRQKKFWVDDILQPQALCKEISLELETSKLEQYELDACEHIKNFPKYLLDPGAVEGAHELGIFRLGNDVFQYFRERIFTDPIIDKDKTKKKRFITMEYYSRKEKRMSTLALEKVSSCGIYPRAANTKNPEKSCTPVLNIRNKKNRGFLTLSAKRKTQVRTLGILTVSRSAVKFLLEDSPHRLKTFIDSACPKMRKHSQDLPRLLVHLNTLHRLGVLDSSILPDAVVREVSGAILVDFRLRTYVDIPTSQHLTSLSRFLFTTGEYKVDLEDKTSEKTMLYKAFLSTLSYPQVKVKSILGRASLQHEVTSEEHYATDEGRRSLIARHECKTGRFTRAAAADASCSGAQRRSLSLKLESLGRASNIFEKFLIEYRTHEKNDLYTEILDARIEGSKVKHRPENFDSFLAKFLLPTEEKLALANKEFHAESLYGDFFKSRYAAEIAYLVCSLINEKALFNRKLVKSISIPYFYGSGDRSQIIKIEGLIEDLIFLTPQNDVIRVDLLSNNVQQAIAQNVNERYTSVRDKIYAVIANFFTMREFNAKYTVNPVWSYAPGVTINIRECAYTKETYKARGRGKEKRPSRTVRVPKRVNGEFVHDKAAKKRSLAPNWCHARDALLCFRNVMHFKEKKINLASIHDCHLVSPCLIPERIKTYQTNAYIVGNAARDSLYGRLTNSLLVFEAQPKKVKNKANKADRARICALHKNWDKTRISFPPGIGLSL